MALLLLVLTGAPVLALLSSRPVTAQMVSTPERGMVRTLAASPDAPPLDVYVDSTLLASAITFSTLTPVSAITSGDHTLALVTAGGDPKRQTLTSTDIRLDADAFLLIVATGYLTDLRVQTYQQDSSSLDSTSDARIRSINLVPDTADISVAQTDGTSLLPAAAPFAASSYATTPAGHYALAATPSTTNAQPVTLVGLTFLPDATYDIALIGEYRKGSVRAVPVVTATSLPCGIARQTGGPTMGCGRLLNADEDQAPVDVYLGDATTAIASQVAYGTATATFAVPAGATDLVLMPAGTPRDDSHRLAHVSLTGEDGVGVLIVANGNPGKVKLSTFNDVDQPVGGNLARVQMINTASGFGEANVEVNGLVEVKGILQGESSDARLVPAGPYELQITDADSGAMLADSGPMTIVAGQSCRWVIIGNGKKGTVAVVTLCVPIPTDATIASPLS